MIYNNIIACGACVSSGIWLAVSGIACMIGFVGWLKKKCKPDCKCQNKKP